MKRENNFLLFFFFRFQGVLAEAAKTLQHLEYQEHERDEKGRNLLCWVPQSLPTFSHSLSHPRRGARVSDDHPTNTVVQCRWASVRLSRDSSFRQGLTQFLINVNYSSNDGVRKCSWLYNRSKIYLRHWVPLWCGECDSLSVWRISFCSLNDAVDNLSI